MVTVDEKIAFLDARIRQLESAAKASATMASVGTNNGSANATAQKNASQKNGIGFYKWLASLVHSAILLDLKNPKHAACIAAGVLLMNVVFVGLFTYFEIQRCDVFNSIADGDWDPKEYQELYNKPNIQICSSEYRNEEDKLFMNFRDSNGINYECHDWISCTVSGLQSKTQYGGPACDSLKRKGDLFNHRNGCSPYDCWPTYNDDDDNNNDDNNDDDNNDDDNNDDDNNDDDNNDDDNKDDDNKNDDDGNNDDNNNDDDNNDDDGNYDDYNGFPFIESTFPEEALLGDFDDLQFGNGTCDNGSQELVCEGVVSIVYFVCPKLTTVLGATMGYLAFVQTISLGLLLFGYHLCTGRSLRSSLDKIQKYFTFE